jgi:hypothetical protein
MIASEKELTHIHSPLLYIYMRHCTTLPHFHKTAAAAGHHRRREEARSVGAAEDGEDAVLRQGGDQEGSMDAGGGHHPRLLHPRARPRQLEVSAHQHRPHALQQELPPAMDQLPPPRHQARQLHVARGRHHRPPPVLAGQQVLLHASISSSFAHLAQKQHVKC